MGNENISEPFKIVKEKLGYVAFLFGLLKRKRFIVQDKLWDSIASHNCFLYSYRKDVKYLKAKQLAKALNF